MQLRFAVTAQGEVTNIMVVDSSGHRVLDAAAEALVSGIEGLPPFEPDWVAGGVETLEFEVPVDYRLR